MQQMFDLLKIKEIKRDKKDRQIDSEREINR